MRKALQILLRIGALTVAVCLLLLLASLLIMQTAWFKEQVRQRIIAAVEEASGGRVELGAFSYNWSTLTATFKDFVVHGTEPPSSPPLFRAAKIDVRLTILSALERRVAVSSLIIDQPDTFILVHKDGSTNIPSPEMRPKSTDETVRELLNLKLRHLELRHGSLQTELQKVPLNIRCDDTVAVITYNRHGAYYAATLSSRHVTVQPPQQHGVSLTVSAQLHLAHNVLSIESANLTSGSSSLRASGGLRDFANPVLDMQIAADLDAAEAARSAGFSEVRGGRVKLDTNLHRDSVHLYRLTGKITGHKVAIYSSGYDLPDCGLSADISAVPKRMELRSIKFTVPWGQLAGDAIILDSERFSLASHVNAVNVVSAEKFLFDKTLPWTGTAAGTLNMDGLVGQVFRNFVIETNLDVSPGTGAPPVGGHVEVVYRQKGEIIDLGSSYVKLPNTRLTGSGRVGQQLRVSIDTANFQDFAPVFSVQQVKLLPNGNAHFDGDVTGPLRSPAVSGAVALSQFTAAGETWSAMHAHAELTSSSAVLTGLTLDGPIGNVSGSTQLKLADWSWDPDSDISAQLAFRNVLLPVAAGVVHLPSVGVQNGAASGGLNLQGSLQNLHGTAQVAIRDLVVHGQRFDRASANLQINSGKVLITDGAISRSAASLKFSGEFTHPSDSWATGQIGLKADSNVFPLSTISAVREYEPGWDARAEIHLDAGFNLHAGHVDPTVANGTVALRRVTNNGATFGDVVLDASTKGEFLYVGFSGDLRDMNVRGNAEVHLVEGSPVKGKLNFDRVSLPTLYSLVNREHSATLPIEGSLQGSATFEGPLLQPNRLHGEIQFNQAQLRENRSSAASATVPALALHNIDPILLSFSSRRIFIRQLRLAGTDTNFSASGSIGMERDPSLDLKTDGTLDLKLVQLFQPGLQTSGQSFLTASITGTVDKPSMVGSMEIRNGSLFANTFASALTSINGLVHFNRDRANIERLSAKAGGGTVSVDGFVDFSTTGPWIFRLNANAEAVRLRYANSISVTANSQLRLTGTTKRSVLSGTATVSRVVFTPNADLGTLLATSFAPASSATEENNFLANLQFDVQVQSAPDLEVTTQLSRDVQAEIDLRLRGTPGHAALLGDIVANQGDIKIFGGKYSINRGEIRFVNAARIEPVLDLDLQTIARGITVDVTIAGTLGKLNINYRSDPPLQPREILALLTVGRVPDTATVSPNVQNTTDTSAMQYGANTVLGQAISPVSNRISKLFGITNIKIDPLVQGVTNAPASARLTLEEQVSREITVTYITNLSQTSEQIFRVEWAFSPQYSVVALRDDNGEFGIDIQYKKRFK